MTLLRETLRPGALPAGRVATCVGLIADTHLPDRCLALPPAVFDVFHGVEMIVHAGDVGARSLLDELGAVAPVAAVRGNDECVLQDVADLPAERVVEIAGWRIAVVHGHEASRWRELRTRREDAWGPKLARRAAAGQRMGARIVVYGHTHVPADAEHAGVRLVNPGALAPGSLVSRLRHQTVALLYLRDDGAPFAVHVDLARPDRPFSVAVDWAAGFRAARACYDEPLLAPEVVAAARRQWALAPLLGPLAGASLRSAVRDVALRCWTGEQERITGADIVEG
ncbi:MAG: metallophosphatase family protein, partial [Chloroflexota bacterium]|nr:metallophosphatase family protein [Chloroflexota bacterium]